MTPNNSYNMVTIWVRISKSNQLKQIKIICQTIVAQVTDFMIGQKF